MRAIGWSIVEHKGIFLALLKILSLKMTMLFYLINIQKVVVLVVENDHYLCRRSFINHVDRFLEFFNPFPLCGPFYLIGLM